MPQEHQTRDDQCHASGQPDLPAAEVESGGGGRSLRRGSWRVCIFDVLRSLGSHGPLLGFGGWQAKRRHEKQFKASNRVSAAKAQSVARTSR